MKNPRENSIWFAAGSQNLYGEETLIQVEKDAKIIADSLNGEDDIPCKVEYNAVLKTSEEISLFCEKANNDPNCIGVITWMHTFSPAKMWIAGLKILNKPLLHLHTQFNRDIPWETINMDFMNLNQAAHGDREFGFIGTRMNIARKICVGYWKNKEIIKEIGIFARVAGAFSESRNLRVARFGDNMRDVAVTEGDKVEAQIKFGWSVNGYGVGDLVKYIDAVSAAHVLRLMDEYNEKYDMSAVKTEEDRLAVMEQARIEIGMRRFLEAGGFGAFTTTFEDLYGISQLPGLAVQRLMEKGYGFAGEGDWKTAAMVRIMKVMADGLEKGTSFMEDYTYHMEPGNEMVLGAHMLEVCPTLAKDRPKIEVHPLGIGGKNDPARIVFEGKTGPALNASLIDMGNRFRLIVNLVDSVNVEKPTPKLPVAKVLWKPQPSLSVAAKSWISAGGAHHTCFSYDVTKEYLIDFAEMTGIECVVIDNKTEYADFRNELRWNSVYWGR